MTVSFQPQPYPLYAVTLEKAGEPSRFQLTDDPIRLVLGWCTDDQGEVTPMLAAGNPAGTPWTGLVFYEETRDRAQHLAKEISRADRASVRDARLLQAMAWLGDKEH